ncbi:hypothetical protein ABZ502_16785 [Streptomyces abikoensis]|uniref:hypothetical protein n=1 Tax=Streptomyces abikoensis TaxID=97398 RepID=UPI0033CE3ED1
MARYRRGVGGLLSDLTDDFGDMVNDVFGGRGGWRGRDGYGDWDWRDRDWDGPWGGPYDRWHGGWGGPYDRWGYGRRGYGPWCDYGGYPPPWADGCYGSWHGCGRCGDGPYAARGSSREEIGDVREDVRALARAVKTLAREDDDRPPARPGHRTGTTG